MYFRILSATGLEANLDAVQQPRVYGRDDACVGLPGIWNGLLFRAPQRESRRITAEFSRRLPEFMRTIGVSASTAHLRFGDDWTLTPERLD